MVLKILLPHRYKKIGWFILIPATILGVILMLTDFNGLSVKTTVFAMFTGEIFNTNPHPFSFIQTDVTNTFVAVLFITGALFVGFSKEKTEDEFIAGLRLSSLLWAVLVNYLLLVFSFVFIYGTAFLYVMLYNMFTVLILFIARFNYLLYRYSKQTPDEK